MQTALQNIFLEASYLQAVNMSGVLILLSKARDGWLSHLYLQEFSLQFKHPNKNPHSITAILLVRLGAPIALSSCAHPRIASHTPMCTSPRTAWPKESWAKADGGMFLYLCTCCLYSSGRQLRQESIQQTSAGERHGNTIVRLSLWVLLVGFPPKCQSALSVPLRYDELRTHSCILIAGFCLRKVSCNSPEVSVINLPHHFHLLFCPGASQSVWLRNAASPEHCQQKWRDGLWVRAPSLAKSTLCNRWLWGLLLWWS